MGVQFLEEYGLFQLDTENTSYVIGVVDEEKFLGHAYYGTKIAMQDSGYLLRTMEAPFVPSENNRDRTSFYDQFPFEYTGNGLGDYRESPLVVEREDGTRGVLVTLESYEILKQKPVLKGLPSSFACDGGALVLHCADVVLGLKVDLVYGVFEKEDVITRSIIVRNESKEDLWLRKVFSVCMDMENRDYEMVTLHGSWARERQIDVRSLGYGKQSVGSVRGESSHQEHPFLAIKEKNATSDIGEVYGMQFVYSGNFLAQVEKTQMDNLRVVMGIHPEGFGWKLAVGEEFTAPEVLMTFSAVGMGQMSRNFHDMIREHLIRSPYRNQKRPILINNWEATYFQFDTEKLLSIARCAASLGIEMLVMDDGWFGHRDDDSSSLGDWFVNEKKLPGGLKYLVDEVNRLGMKFGIWFEPEMISPDSELYKMHPDWAIQIAGREASLCRCQYVLDLSRREVLDYVYESVAKVLRSANIEYVKWDMNRQLSDLGSAALPGSRAGELCHRYVLGVYELQERLLNEFPKLLLENCSGGGARFDAGMLYYSPQIWCSDDTDAVERLKIQEGTALAYPLSAIGAHVSVCPNHTVGRNTPFETRGYVALAGTFGYELDVTKLSEEDKGKIPGQNAMYHRFSALVQQGDYYRIASYAQNGEYDCYMVVSKDKREALVTFVQVLNRPNFRSRMIRLKGLDPQKRYCVEVPEWKDGWKRTEGSNSGEIQSGNESATIRSFGGDLLMNGGLTISNPWGDFQGKLLYLWEKDLAEDGER